MLIGILQTGRAPDALRPDHGDYPDMFTDLLAGHGLTFRTWHVEEMEFPEDVHAAEGWLITGSRHGAYEDHPFIPPLEDFLRRAYAAKVPIVGICFGHQILAQALGGKVEKYRGGWSVGPTDYDFDGQTLRLNAWHQDQVVEKPAEADVIATSPFCRFAGLAYGDRALTVQPHPEFGDAFVDGLMRTRGRGVVPDTLMDVAADKLGQPNSAAAMADRIAAFFHSHER